jgi:hypothetical protein
MFESKRRNNVAYISNIVYWAILKTPHNFSTTPSPEPDERAHTWTDYLLDTAEAMKTAVA